MTAFDDFLEFLNMEIHRYRESRPSLRYQVLCWISRVRPRHETIVAELELVYRRAYRMMIRLEEERPQINRMELLEALARHSHSQWMEWSRTIAENECLSPARLKRWQGQLWKPYDELTEEWKEQDRIRAREIIEIVENYHRAAERV